MQLGNVLGCWVVGLLAALAGVLAQRIGRAYTPAARELSIGNFAKE
jgi:hypothetical protein